MSQAKQKDKLLAEWFWTDRWMGSSGFLLPLEPRGLYREMLTQAWRRGARLPNDHEAIRRAVGCTAAEWRRCWPIVERFWRVEGDYLVNETQLEVYAEAKAEREGAETRAREAANKRWGRRDAQAMRTHSGGNAAASVPAMLEQCPPSPLTDNNTPLTPRAGGDAAASVRNARARLERQVEDARQFAVANGHRPGRSELRAIRGWFKAGHSLADVQAAIERGEHVKRPRL